MSSRTLRVKRAVAESAARRAVTRPFTVDPGPVVSQPLMPSRAVTIGGITPRISLQGRPSKPGVIPGFVGGGPDPGPRGGDSILGGLDPCANVPSYLQGLCRSGAGWVENWLGGGNGSTGSGMTASECGPGQVKMGGKCVAPGDVFPGGDPFVMTAGGQATMGRYGAAETPTVTTQQVLRCPPGTVLGKDNLCYDGLAPRSNKRKYKRPKAPKISAAEWKAISAANKVREKAKEVAQDVGWKVTKSKR